MGRLAHMLFGVLLFLLCFSGEAFEPQPHAKSAVSTKKQSHPMLPSSEIIDGQEAIAELRKLTIPLSLLVGPGWLITEKRPAHYRPSHSTINGNDTEAISRFRNYMAMRPGFTLPSEDHKVRVNRSPKLLEFRWYTHRTKSEGTYIKIELLDSGQIRMTWMFWNTFRKAGQQTRTYGPSREFVTLITPPKDAPKIKDLRLRISTKAVLTSESKNLAVKVSNLSKRQVWLDQSKVSESLEIPLGAKNVNTPKIMSQTASFSSSSLVPKEDRFGKQHNLLMLDKVDGDTKTVHLYVLPLAYDRPSFPKYLGE